MLIGKVFQMQDWNKTSRGLEYIEVGEKGYGGQRKNTLF